jgi:Na+-transporting methylmalonyl-CoA/oxaloacetate decarboxylase gamma subunit
MAAIVKQLTPVAETAGATDEEVAAITAAISQHRKAQN